MSQVPADSDPLVLRFSLWARLQHASVILLFGVLLVTGLPQKWPTLGVSQWTVDAVGGLLVARWLHRAAGVGLAILLVAHLAAAVTGILTRRMRPSMMLSRQDFTDALDNLRYYAGWREAPPRFGRFDYRQKFEYWGLIFGSVIMVVTGFILYFPIALSQWLPAELIPAAKVMHSFEALLALAIVIVWHLTGAHLAPESFPMDTSIFTGKVRKSRLKHEHPLEYEELFGKE